MKRNRIRLTESQLHRVIKESVKKVLKEAYDGEVGFNIVVEENCPQEDLEQIEILADSCGVDNSGYGDFYVYDEQPFRMFMNKLKTLLHHMRQNGNKSRVFLYQGEAPDYEWELVDTL